MLNADEPEKADLIWRNGAIMSADGAVSARDRGFTLGDGAFETMRLREGRIVFWADHRARLLRGLAFLGVPTPACLDEAPEGVFELARRRGLAAGDAVARLTVTRGLSAQGLAPASNATPTVIATLAAAPEATPTPRQLTPYTEWRRGVEAASQFKHLSGYAPNIAAARAARSVGADDAILFNEAGRVVSISIGNIYAIDAAGCAVTPPLCDGALPGVCRAILISRGLVDEAPIDRSRLDEDLLLVSNVARGVQTAELADGPRWSTATAAQKKAADRLQAAFADALAADALAADAAPGAARMED
ncbi:MAG: aminotransferase class IV [Pseudomonadota bacterium]